MREGHLPQVFVIGADNTRKETKNQYCMWFLAWLLCALRDTPLRSIEVVFLLVGHTHNKLDRLFLAHLRGTPWTGLLHSDGDVAEDERAFALLPAAYRTFGTSMAVEGITGGSAARCNAPHS